MHLTAATIAQLLEGRLAPPKLAQVHEHADKCERCRLSIVQAVKATPFLPADPAGDSITPFEVTQTEVDPSRRAGPEAIGRILATAALRHGADDEVLRELAKALAQLEARLGPEDPALAAVLQGQGALLGLLGKADASIAHLQRALAIRRKAHGARNPATAEALASLATAFANDGRHAEADSAQGEALQLFEAVHGPDHASTAGARLRLALLRVRGGRSDDAVALLLRAIPVLERTLGAAHRDVGFALASLGSVLISMGDLRGASPCLERGLAVLDKAGVPTALIACSLAYAKLETGAPGARQLLERARGSLESGQGADPYVQAYCGFLLARALAQDEGGAARAKEIAAEARAAAERVRLAGDRHELGIFDRWLRSRGY